MESNININCFHSVCCMHITFPETNTVSLDFIPLFYTSISMNQTHLNPFTVVTVTRQKVTFCRNICNTNYDYHTQSPNLHCLLLCRVWLSVRSLTACCLLLCRVWLSVQSPTACCMILYIVWLSVRSPTTCCLLLCRVWLSVQSPTACCLLLCRVWHMVQCYFALCQIFKLCHQISLRKHFQGSGYFQFMIKMVIKKSRYTASLT